MCSLPLKPGKFLFGRFIPGDIFEINGIGNKVEGMVGYLSGERQGLIF
jgi:hypothetical protein